MNFYLACHSVLLVLLSVTLIDLHIIQFGLRCTELFFKVAHSSLQRFRLFARLQCFLLCETRSCSFLKSIEMFVRMIS